MKFTIKYYHLLILSILLVILPACYNPFRISYFNISSSYEEQSKNFDLNFCAYTVSINQAQVYFHFNTSPLLFVKHKTKNFFFAKYQIRYEVYDENEPRILLDSATFTYLDSTDFNRPRMITDSFPVIIQGESNYILAFQFTDLNKHYEINGFINIDKTNQFSRNNFLLNDTNNLPLVKNYIKKDQPLSIKLNNKQFEKLFVTYYKEEFPLAEPPYTINKNVGQKISPDSVFTLDLHNGTTDNMVLKAPGLYFFQTDTNQKEGFTILRFHTNFPRVTSPVQMLKPLQYITTKQEFSDLVNSKTLKQDIENFWIERSGNSDRAKEMIRLFYNRVQDANIYFTSYKEGWKTDRGMIFLIMGPPLRVYRSATNETWYYGEDRNMMSVTIIFNKEYSEFSDNNYIMDRGIEFKDAWYRSVETWRK